MFAPGTATNQQNIGVTIRPPATALLTIDSEDRFKNYLDKRNSEQGSYNWSPYDFSITRNESLMNGFFTRLAVSEVQFPTDDIPNISKTTDKIILEYEIGATTASTIVSTTHGFYTPSELATTLQANVRATVPSLSTFTMTYGTDIFSGTPSPQFLYQGNTTESVSVAFLPLTYNTSLYPYNENTRQLYDLLGMNSANSVLQPAALTGLTNCQGTAYIDIVSPQITYNQALKDTSSQPITRDSLCRLYLTPNSYVNSVSPNSSNYAPPGTVPTVIYRNFAQPKQISWTPNQPVGQLTFQVYDDCGNLITPVINQSGAPANNVNWAMSILVSEN